MAKRKMTFDYGRFFLMTNTAYIDYAGEDKVEIGKIIDTTCDKEVMYIYYNRHAFSDNGYHMTFIVHVIGGEKVPVVYIDDMYRAYMVDHPTGGQEYVIIS